MSQDALSADLSAYHNWREQIVRSVNQLQKWLTEHDLNDAQLMLRSQQLVERLRDDKLNIAFVAEFSRGKSELINSIFFAGYGQRILPSSAGRTTMCPTELMYDSLRPISIQLLPIETRDSSTTTAEYKRYADEWMTIPLDLDSADAMMSAFQRVGETKRVPTEVAKRYGLFNEDDQDSLVTVHADGTVDIPCWRHAIINFPHPLLQQGLVILDTPGLNAIGAEPELTLSMLPSAHAIVFILGADTGVTRSDLDIWREYIAGHGRSGGRVVVLNKIDGLWDPLKTEAEIDAEISKQVVESAELLGLKSTQVFPVSAQKGLVAKIQGDAGLLAKSRMPALEAAIAEGLIPAKQDIVRDATQNEIEVMVSDVRSILQARNAGIQEQLDELRALKGKNRDTIVSMLDKIAEEKQRFEKGLAQFQALRSVFSQQTNILFGFLGKDALKAEIQSVRESMQKSMLSAGLSSAMNGFFRTVNDRLTQAAGQVTEIQAMMGGMYQKFSQEHGLAKVTPSPFSTLKYHKEINRLEKVYRAHFSGFGTMLTTRQETLTHKFFETIANNVVYVFDVANRDVEAWLKAIMAPMETQVREHQLQLRRRLENVKRIHKATDTLEERVIELETVAQAISDQQANLDKVLKEVYRILNVDASSLIGQAA
ncbi:dynamin family protein [Leeia sp. TBRC 13508]|uniref:Dynamin family protein n=1 Tax=Leeia speluncae TaxID=2884804 RepID=A0ABS8D2T8_9NEIS|nr:dynamin family protein [Leeia speluncae]MCB6182513.1 dynamin family protein [Leeia speluncae]